MEWETNGCGAEVDANTGVARVGGDRLPDILTNEVGVAAVGVTATGELIRAIVVGWFRGLDDGDGDAAGVLSFFFCLSEELFPIPKVFMRKALNPDGPDLDGGEAGDALGPLALA